MSGYGPFGFSQTWGFSQERLRAKGATADKPGTIGIMIVYMMMRFALAVDCSLLFELMGAFVLTQFGYSGYDFEKTHKKAEAIVFIGTTGGVALGIALIAIDLVLSGNVAVNDLAAKPSKLAAAVATATGTTLPSHRTMALAGCVMRALLWPGLGALAGVTGTQLWHLSQNAKPQPKAKYRSTTGAVVQLVGAMVVVTFPSVLQFILFGVLPITDNITK